MVRLTPRSTRTATLLPSTTLFRSAREAGQLTGDDKAALPLYQRILALQPENTGALEGREDALGELLQQARAQLRAGDLAEATAAIAAARRFDAGHVDLPDTQARVRSEERGVGKEWVRPCETR